MKKVMRFLSLGFVLMSVHSYALIPEEFKSSANVIDLSPLTNSCPKYKENLASYNKIGAGLHEKFGSQDKFPMKETLNYLGLHTSLVRLRDGKECTANRGEFMQLSAALNRSIAGK